MAPGLRDAIRPFERGMAGTAHLSGLGGCIVRPHGAIVPIAIWIARHDSLVASGLAK